MTEIVLDATDKKIIQLLQDNSRIRISEIARKIGNMTENAIRYRIDKLESEGYISAYTIHLNRKKFGKDLTAIFNLNVLPDNIKRAVDLLKTLDSLTEIYITTGAYSIIAIGYFNDRNELSKFITDNLKKIKMIDFEVVTVLDRIKHELYAI